MIHLLLVDDHPSVMEGTKVLLEQDGEINVTLASTPEQALKLATSNMYEVILVDLHMPEMNGIDLARQLLEGLPEAIILIYTGFELSNHFNLMMEAGVAGFVSKTAGKEQLVTAVRCALRGEVVLPVSLVRQLRRVSIQTVGSMAEPEAGTITGKEYEILKQIAGGKSNKEIAEVLLTSQRSLEYALTTLFQKLGVKSRIDAVIKARSLGLLTDSDFVKKPR